MGGCYWGWMAVKEREERHVARAERRGRYAWGERDWKLWRQGTSTPCSHELGLRARVEEQMRVCKSEGTSCRAIRVDFQPEPEVNMQATEGHPK